PRDGAATRERILDSAQALVLERGFAATSVEAVIAAAETTKGAFFHHFPSKRDLGRALLTRYAAADERILDEFMAGAESESDDPAEQAVAFVRRFEEAADELMPAQPGCLFVSFVYESQLEQGSDELIRESILAWRERIHAKLEAAAVAHPPPHPVDLRSLADHVFTTFEGSFILARAMGDPDHLRAQLAQLRHYLELLFGIAEG
ncbi:MAG TPA: TetR/AcrR family transcriptional regulator, partial [Solirubrobacterales bacterium]|nr:TetR/AcrR family transcriptional regulator [Solirubrobacterales bacterium]